MPPLHPREFRAVRIDPNTARSMTGVAREPRGVLTPPSDAMLTILARMKAGAVIVSAQVRAMKNKRMICEMVGRPDDPECEPEDVSSATVRGLEKRGLIVVASRTSRTKTWVPSESATVEGV